ncbi:Hypothetical protein NTJ_15052 [Nesidiocoris tenuis]|uniref:Uncharacterized protein n=1 Tax=Nesidiocoris tenuis TaxID=355587 RepID=A0ABN7BD99_9HEMI|nr:Hypothetical protein NTJ_15052 [Nesidiocoris tenuis]
MMNWLIVGIVSIQAVAWIAVCSFLMIKGVSNLITNTNQSASPDPRAYKTGIILLSSAAVVFLLPPLVILAVKKLKKPSKPKFTAVPQNEDLPPSYEEAMQLQPTKSIIPNSC